MSSLMTYWEIDDFLAHYGVKGMKWGVRKSRSSGSAGSANKVAIKKPTTTTSVPAVKPKPKPKLTDEELRRKIARLQMERQYAQLTNSSSPKGENFAKKFMGTMLKDVVYPAAKDVGKDLLKEVMFQKLEKKMGYPMSKKTKHFEGKKNKK